MIDKILPSSLVNLGCYLYYSLVNVAHIPNDKMKEKWMKLIILKAEITLQSIAKSLMAKEKWMGSFIETAPQMHKQQFIVSGENDPLNSLLTAWSSNNVSSSSQ